jgi:3-mercaptopyruvate sulfurtransferase SseA
MRKIFILAVVLIFGLGAAGFALAADNPLVDQEKAVHKTFTDAIPADRFINAEQFKKVYDDVMAGKKKAYLIDVRSHPEFYAFHIEGTDHVHAGHMYTIPKLIPDPNAEIYIW